MENHLSRQYSSGRIVLHTQDTEDAANLVRRADIAMYLSKEQGKNTY